MYKYNLPLCLREDAWLRESHEGISPRGRGGRPGPLDGSPGVLGNLASEGPQDLSRAAAVEAGGLFTVAAHSYRLRLFDIQFRRRHDEELLSPEEAAVVLERAIVQYERDRDLQQVLETAFRHLAGLYPNGSYVVLRIVPEIDIVTIPGEPAGPVATPSAFRPSEPVELPSTEDEPIVGDDQAAVLREAAELGVPFCEECARARRRAALSDGAHQAGA